MKIHFDQLNSNLKGNLRNIFRKCGYVEIYDRQSGKTSYVRRLGANFYPRFHLYAEQRDNGLIMDLHLDQKRASYRGQTAHSGEYDNELVQGEVERIKNIIK